MPASRRIGVVTALVGAVTVLALGGCGVGDSSTVVPPPTATQNAETVEVLRRAAAEHGICYGWELSGNGSELSAGSNLGEGIRASESPMCPRWLEGTARTSSSSKSVRTAKRLSSSGRLATARSIYSNGGNGSPRRSRAS